MNVFLFCRNTFFVFVFRERRGVCVLGGKLIIEELEAKGGRDKEKKRRREGTMVYVDIRRRTGDR